MGAQLVFEIDHSEHHFTACRENPSPAGWFNPFRAMWWFSDTYWFVKCSLNIALTRFTEDVCCLSFFKFPPPTSAFMLWGSGWWCKFHAYCMLKTQHFGFCSLPKVKNQEHLEPSCLLCHSWLLKQLHLISRACDCGWLFLRGRKLRHMLTGEHYLFLVCSPLRFQQ